MLLHAGSWAWPPCHGHFVHCFTSWVPSAFSLISKMDFKNRNVLALKQDTKYTARHGQGQQRVVCYQRKKGRNDYNCLLLFHSNNQELCRTQGKTATYAQLVRVFLSSRVVNHCLSHARKAEGSATSPRTEENACAMCVTGLSLGTMPAPRSFGFLKSIICLQ